MEALPILTMWTTERNNSVREEWSWHVNSIVAWCHSAKLCAYAARDFRSQHYFLFYFNRIKIFNQSAWFLKLYMNMLCIPLFNRKRRKLIGQNKVNLWKSPNFNFVGQKLVALLISNDIMKQMLSCLELNTLLINWTYFVFHMPNNYWPG